LIDHTQRDSSVSSIESRVRTRCDWNPKRVVVTVINSMRINEQSVFTFDGYARFMRYFSAMWLHPNRLAFTLALAGTLVVAPCSRAASTEATPNVLKGGVSETSMKPLATVNATDLKTLPAGLPMDITISTSLETGLSASGDEFFGKLLKPVMVDGKVILPSQTVVHGMVKEIADPKRGGRNGHVTASFDYLITPDGREIPIEGGYTNKDSALKATAKVVGRGAGYTLTGGAIGALVVLRYGGLAAVTASNGYALAGGAAVGGVVGLGAAAVTKGRSLWIPPGTEMRLTLKEHLTLPSMNSARVGDQRTVRRAGHQGAFPTRG
jgi:hypothetical protein